MLAWLSPSRAVYWFLDSWRVLLRLALAGLGVWWCMSNFVWLDASEQALVTRYGKYHATLDAGWHFRWPYPFEQVRRFQFDAIRSLSLGPRGETSAKAARGKYVPPIEWQAAHGDQDAAAREEALLLAGAAVKAWRLGCAAALWAETSTSA